MKTILEWYQELPEPYRTQAIKNCVDGRGQVEVESRNLAISGGFDWWTSPEGGRYWSEFNKFFPEIERSLDKQQSATLQDISDKLDKLLTLIQSP